VKVNDIKTADSGGYIINGEEDAYLNMNSEIDFDSSSTQFPSTISYSVTFLYGFALSISPDGSSGTGGKFVLVIEAENSGSIDAESETDVSNNMTIGSFSGSLKVYDNNNELVHDYDLTEQEIYTLSGINPDNFI
jgi:hypothetical protein